MASSLDPAAILGQLTQQYFKLPLVQKIVLPLLIVASVTGIIYVSKWSNSPDYSVLFSSLDPIDSAAVLSKLKEKKIKYEVRGDGSTIAISPPELVHELRISLAGEGLPRGGSPGLEIFDVSSLGTTTFQEKIKFIRAIQGELERTIESLDAVMSARVHITQPEKSVYAKHASEATASVMLRLSTADGLDKKQIKGITNLVARSVDGLDPKNVTIVDTQGNLLSVNEEEQNSFGLEATQLEYQRQIEASFVRRVEDMLSKVLGPGKVISRVTAELDFSTNEREEESFDPAGQVVRAEKIVEEGVGSTQRGGIPGVVSNLTDSPNLLTPPGSGQEQANRKENLKNYEVSRAISRSTSPKGKLTRISVAVLVDGTYEVPAGAAPDAPAEFRPLETDVMGRIESVVKNAVGYDAARGDTLTVENIPFHIADKKLEAEMIKKENLDWYLNRFYDQVLPVLFIVFFFFLVVRPLVKFLITPTEAEVDLGRLLPTGIEELEKELEAERKRPEIPVAENAVDLEQLEELMGENSRLVKENPQQAALLIRYWLNDGRI